MGMVFWQWMTVLLVAAVGYPLAFIARHSALKEKEAKARKAHQHKHA